MEEKVVSIINEMAEYLNVSQMKKLQEVLLKTFSEHEQQKQKLVIVSICNCSWMQRKSKVVLNEQFNTIEPQ